MPDFSYILVAAAAVGAIHMAAPDHWMTITMLGKGAGWNRRRIVLLSAMAGAGHSGISVALGFLVVAFGLIFSKYISGFITTAIGTAMIIIGMYVVASSVMHRHSHGDDESAIQAKFGERIENSGRMKTASYFAVLGAALSPDLTILPVFLLAIQTGWALTFDTALVFSVASILTITAVVIVTYEGITRMFERLKPEYNDAIVGLVILAVGIYVILFP